MQRTAKKVLNNVAEQTHVLMSKQSTFTSSKPKKRVGRGQQYVQDFLLKKIAISDRLVGLLVIFVKGATRNQCFYTKYAHVQGGGGRRVYALRCARILSRKFHTTLNIVDIPQQWPLNYCLVRRIVTLHLLSIK